MADFTYPGVYYGETQGAPGPITGSSTSTLGLVGWSPRGLVGEPTISNSYKEYVSQFGDMNADSISGHSAYAFFANGGGRMYFVRAVHDDAVKSYYDLAYTMVTPEDLTSTAQGSGIYNLDLGTVPVVPSSLVLTFENATPASVNVFVDDGLGSLTLDTDLSGASAAGGAGTVDYTTGEITITLNNPSQFSGSAQSVTAEYGYVLYRFEMKWAGAEGDLFRVRVAPGSDYYLVQAEARWTRFTVIIDENVGTVAIPSWIARETFADVSLTDPTSTNFISTVINADDGSNHFSVVDYGNNLAPQSLQGTSVTAEDVLGTMAHSDASAGTEYNGSWKGWTYSLDSDVFANSFSASFTFNDGIVQDSGVDSTSSSAAFLTDTTKAWTTNAFAGYIVKNVTDGSSALIISNTATTIVGTLTGGTADEWNADDVYSIVEANVQIGVAGTPAAATATVVSPGSASAPAQIVPGSVVIRTELASAGEVIIVDDGAGALYDGTAGSAGTIDYTTGVITGGALDVSGVTAWGADTFAAGATIKFSCEYAVAVKVEDDADGNLSIAAVQTTGYPQKFQLNTAGTNSIDYDAGEFTLTWKIAGEPTNGPGSVSAQTATYYTQPASSVTGAMANGSDGSAVDSGDVVGPALAVEGLGLYAFEKVDETMQVVIADFQTDTYVQDALLTYCELKRDKFAIMSAPYGLSYQEVVNWKKFQFNRYSSYGAIYYPHIKIKDPVTDVNIDIPGGGHIAGIYARTDSQFNVSTAPAGMGKGNIAWSTGLEVDLTEAQVGLLNPNNVNCLVQWPNTGRVVWGARTVDAAGGEWPYIQMRRLFIYLEKSVYNASQVHVFKNNGPELWTAIRTQVTTFLTDLYNSKYFAGGSASEAFFVVCDGTNNPQSTVDKGITYCDIGVAPTKPGEFIMFRFSQITQ